MKVYRDRWGVPHIYATSQQDLFVAQGFVQAQDRLWQMETNRRLAAGRLSEVLGLIVLVDFSVTQGPAEVAVIPLIPPPIQYAEV